MIINCVWEHNGNDTLLYATNFVGAYTRGESLEIAKAKMPQEIVSYCNWLGMDAAGETEVVIVGEKRSELTIRDADSDVLFESEQAPLTIEEYEALKRTHPPQRNARPFTENFPSRQMNCTSIPRM